MVSYCKLQMFASPVSAATENFLVTVLNAHFLQEVSGLATLNLQNASVFLATNQQTGLLCVKSDV
jgi:hypothetical protein